MPKHSPETPRDVVKQLEADGWYVKRKGPGDHLQFAHPQKPERRVSVDMGAREVPIGTLRSIYRQAGWKW
jgi:predicted RNA binding protein YcfA (HicA-like mRNA interferase family)